ncbi:uncharacterized protein LOC129773806 [Toxorhynchites rutilus septentrionalis]|uniref:uncharacterized protein LOC129773806 n=1 Tax=Toxorhynchites rutilus septentrionalis TaxID=329112 RepID=UPI00247A2447|nr:uncharacterized protein LOC129773806 [Toxorhynchites rutilus septentrionalis]
MFDTEKFISEVKRRPALYDVRSSDYVCRELKAQCWADIGAIMYRDWKSMSATARDTKCKGLIKKWKAVRDNFVKDQRIQQEAKHKKRRYVYHDQLQFLLPHLKGNENYLSKNGHIESAMPLDQTASNDDEDDHKQISIDPFTSSVAVFDESALRKLEQEGDVYGHRTFLMSYVPLLNSLPLHAALQARIQIAQVISDFHTCSSEEFKALQQ